MADINVEELLDARFEQELANPQPKHHDSSKYLDRDLHDMDIENHSRHHHANISYREDASPVARYPYVRDSRLSPHKLSSSMAFTSKGDPAGLYAADADILNQGLDDIEVEVSAHLRRTSRGHDDFDDRRSLASDAMGSRYDGHESKSRSHEKRSHRSSRTADHDERHERYRSSRMSEHDDRYERYERRHRDRQAESERYHHPCEDEVDHEGARDYDRDPREIYEMYDSHSLHPDYDERDRLLVSGHDPRYDERRSTRTYHDEEGSRRRSTRSRDTRSPSRSYERERDRDRRSRRSDRDRRSRHSRSPSRRSKRRSSRSASRSRSRDAPRHRDEPTKAPSAGKERSHVETVEDVLERDKRTVFCMQLAARLRSHELVKFFEACGKVRDASLVIDKHTGRSKGVAYVEFYEVEAVSKALEMTGQKLLGIPIIVQLTEAERNRVALQAASKTVDTAASRIYVGSLDYSLTEQDVANAFQGFGPIEFINIHMDKETGHSKGYAFVQYTQEAHARAAANQMNGHILMGRPIRVNLISEKSQSAPVTNASNVGIASENIATFNMDDGEMEGFQMNSLSRAELMAKLARTEPTLSKTSASVAAISTKPAVVVPTMETRCVLLKNMFNPENEVESNWVQEIEEDVKEECTKFGKILHISVDPESHGHVYLKFDSLVSSQAAVKALHGRFFAGARIEALYIADQVYDAQHPLAAGL
ncbi:hypothetical protein BDV3_006033 [Batrachochytrium dendrobatidis]|uniref:RRM domain-containing protein n=1 Tax=Batrachochytrium dendrobatidis (strain JEL423) TaxID=403673 RepID=A0A177WP05_BATDL|nr:Phosphatidylinositol-3-phosphatase SAC1 [Batrachochytrium dendrobatidis]OAJ41170.1 hypothetical protein BDEG_24810 [Batrachochytrium dendrobatidis JEL423]